MKYLKPGDPCPLCGQPIKTDKYEELELLSCYAWLKENAWLPESEEPKEDGSHA